MPMRILQYAIGRPISYLILNPLFRKPESFKTQIDQNKKYPDPKLSERSDIVIFNVIPESKYPIQILWNWIYHFKNKLLSIPIIRKLIPSSVREEDVQVVHINRVKSEIKQLLRVKSKTIQQIQLKGLEHFKPVERDRIFNELLTEFNYDFRQNAKEYHFFSLKTADNAILDSVEVQNATLSAQSYEDRKFIISCLPRSNNYQDWIRQYRYISDELNATVIGFNYRGCGLSKGIVFTQQNLYNDAKAQAYRLFALGAKPENIAFIGECLGANIATKVAADLHQEGYQVKVFNARSFRSLTMMLLARVTPKANESLLHLKTIFKWLASKIVYFLVIPLLRLSGWDLPVDDAYLSIPQQDKGFLCVRSRKNAQGVRFRDDTMIPHQASIFSLVSNNYRRVRSKLSRNEPLSVNEQACLRDSPKHHRFYVLPRLRTDASIVEGHTCPSRYLGPAYPTEATRNLDGREYMLDFFKRTWSTPREANVDSQSVNANALLPSASAI